MTPALGKCGWTSANVGPDLAKAWPHRATIVQLWCKSSLLLQRLPKSGQLQSTKGSASAKYWPCSVNFREGIGAPGPMCVFLTEPRRKSSNSQRCSGLSRDVRMIRWRSHSLSCRAGLANGGFVRPALYRALVDLCVVQDVFSPVPLFPCESSHKCALAWAVPYDGAGLGGLPPRQTCGCGRTTTFVSSTSFRRLASWGHVGRPAELHRQKSAALVLRK